jgi:osmoprotectant transport system permease protein
MNKGQFPMNNGAALRCAALFIVHCSLFIPALAAQDVRIGSKAFNEGVILGEILTQLAAQTGARVEHKSGMGGTGVLWGAFKAGEIDAYVEYTGTLLHEIYSTEAPSGEAALRRLLERDGLRLGAALGFNNTYAVGMARDVAEGLGIIAISDLTKHPALRLGFSNEFVERADGWPALRRVYGLPHRVTGLEHTLAYEALAAGRIDATDLYSTDAEIEQYNLRVLADDRGLFPEYRAVVVYRAALAPAVVAAFERLDGRIHEAPMVRMNAAVKIDRRSEADVARQFVREILPALEAGADAESQAEQVRAGTRVGLGARIRAAFVALPRRTLEHLLLVMISLLAGAAVALPLGVIAQRRRRLGQAILGSAGVMQTVPSIALLVLLIPLVGIGWWPAVIALFLYSLLPIVRNTHAGLHDMDPRLIESAAALGLSPFQRLRLIELPLSARAILAGVKTAAVINVGTATLGGFIGAGGYGQTIFSGIRLQDNVQILMGAIPAALLAIGVQILFELLERRVVPKGLRPRPAAG